MKISSILLVVLLSGCATSFKDYDCGYFEEEPKWMQFEPSKNLENELVSKISIKEPSLKQLNSLNNKKFWYLGGNGNILLCVTGKLSYPNSFMPGCWVDRYVFENENDIWAPYVTDYLICTG